MTGLQVGQAYDVWVLRVDKKETVSTVTGKGVFVNTDGVALSRINFVCAEGKP